MRPHDVIYSTLGQVIVGGLEPDFPRMLLTGPTSGTTGVPATFTVTPRAALPVALTVDISAPGATLSVLILSFAQGATAGQTFTVIRASGGTTRVAISTVADGVSVADPIQFTTT